MRRDWPLVAAGAGIAAIGAVVLACLLLGYAFEPPTVPVPCDPPEPPAALADGCGLAKQSFRSWATQPAMSLGYGFVLVLLVIAGETIRRGLRQRARV
jgi:hypothetical protein